MRLKYHTYEFDKSDIHVRTLRNRQEFHDPLHAAEALGITSANWSLFGVVWESGQALAQIMWQRENTNERILEVGCGIGLASLALAMQEQNISATDRHPDAQKFLEFNARLNDMALIPFERCSWERPGTDLGRFDLIIGSDLLYEKTNVDLLSRFIEAHTEPKCEVLLTDPGRGLSAQFSKQMEHLGYRCDDRLKFEQPLGNNPAVAYKGHLLRFARG